MIKDSSIDVGCGTYGVSIAIPSSHETLWAQQCYEAGKFGPLGVNEKEMHDGVNWFCENKFDDRASMKAGDQPISQLFAHDESGGGGPFDPSNKDQPLGYNPTSHLRYEVHWQDGCQPPPGQDGFNLRTPLAGVVTCKDLLFNNWKDCMCFPSSTASLRLF
jgi:hypothetical protein